MKLEFYYTTTTCSLASHIGLEETGAPFDAHFVKLYREAEVAAYRRVVPSGKVPALRVDGKVLTENLAILAYLGRVFPESGLIPADPFAAASCLSMMGWFASSVHLDRRQARVPSRFTADEATHEALALAGSARFLADVRQIDLMLSDREWLIGDHFTAADGYALVFWAWAVADGQPVDTLPNYYAHAARVMARPAVQRALARERHPLLDL
ncbi:MAG: glutathione S-transferase [Alphaproteobacteria bacterium]|nr:glutathione S-transferase [Alphaproteobacteria bacterium]